jgi:MATE family multidrug resistance protein
LSSASSHPFHTAPNTTLLKLSGPVLLSLVAEPITGLVDTAFVARLGAIPLASLGVGVLTLSSVFWIFNFLGVGSQTETAKSHGRHDRDRVKALASTAILLAVLLALGSMMVGWPLAPWAARVMGAVGELESPTVLYIRIRLFGAPAVLATIAAFGILRGFQDMQAPLRIAIGLNVANILLDPLLIFGWGPIPALGIAGAAMATVVSQWAGAAWALLAVRVKVGGWTRPDRSLFALLFSIAGDLFVRTGLLTLFLLLTTRLATLMGPDGGAAHHAIRQVWFFTALFLDAFALSGQSLIGFFLGAGDIATSRRVAAHVSVWSFITGILLGAGMLLSTSIVESVLVPPSAIGLFYSAWWVAAVAQPINAISFGTDGIHWGTGDFRFLRNAMFLATGVGAALLLLVDPESPDALFDIWLVTSAWIVVRAALGLSRIWPGFGRAPLGRQSEVEPVSPGSGDI